MNKVDPKYLSTIFILTFVLIINTSCSVEIEKSQYKSAGFTHTNDSVQLIDQIFYQKQDTSNQLILNNSNSSLANNSAGVMEIDVWQFHHYIPTENNFIAIWPTHNRYETPFKLKELKEKWGFKKIYIQAHWLINVVDRFIDAGFDFENIIVDLNVGFPNTIKDWEEKYKDVYAFYVDEPYSAKPNYTVNAFKDVYAKIKALEKPLFITGDFKPSDCLDEYVQHADKIMFTAYHRTYQLFGCTFLHWPENIDQRDSWDVMKERYGNKFTSTWIAGHQDTLEYYQLFKKASELNFESIWYYQLQDSSDEFNDNNLAKFCEAAWQNGYLKKINEKVIYEFKCKKNDIPCNCDTSNKNEWRFVGHKSTGLFKEEIITN